MKTMKLLMDACTCSISYTARPHLGGINPALINSVLIPCPMFFRLNLYNAWG
jgi:hypothetical protein